MLICPDCDQVLSGLDVEACPDCGWAPDEAHGVRGFLSSEDRKSPLFADYADNYGAIAADDLEASIQPDSFLRIRTDRQVQALGDISGLDVLDLGIGQGLLLNALRASGAKSVTGIDIASAYLRRYVDAEDVTVLLANAERIPFHDHFDLIIASEILEHVLNPADFLLSARAALRAGGRLVVTVPFKEDLTQYAQSRGCPYGMVHLRAFDRPILNQMLVDAGFRVQGFAYDGFHRYRLRPSIRRFGHVHGLAQRILSRAVPTDEGLYGLDPRVGRIAFLPTVITAVATR